MTKIEEVQNGIKQKFIKWLQSKMKPRNFNQMLADYINVIGIPPSIYQVSKMLRHMTPSA